MELALIITYFGLLTVVSVYGGHRLWMAWLYLRHAQDPPPTFGSFEEPPDVLIQLPIYNERYVAERLIRAVALMRYPSAHFHNFRTA